MKSIIIGTAGHIDHGKTSLVKALTGVDADRLPEEKARGLTIDIGFAFFDLNKDVRVNFVDVPGHERFVKNMLAGATGIDAALLVVAADDGIMPQTREHLDILELLDIKHLIVAITKCDLVEKAWLEMVIDETNKLVSKTGFKLPVFIPVSSTNGTGIDKLKEAISGLTSKIKTGDRRSNFRLPIDRVFSAPGFGCVVTGSVLGGKIRVGDEIELLPEKRVARVRGVEVNGDKSDNAVSGQRAALNLAGIKSTSVERGCELSTPGYLEPVSLIDCELHLHTEVKKNLTNRARVRFHIFTSEVMARVILLDKEVLKPGETCLVQFKLEKKIVAERCDRYIIRSYSPANTIGGGIVLRSYTHVLKRFKTESVEPLKIVASGVVDDIVMSLLSKVESYSLSVKDIIKQLNVSSPEANNVVKKLVKSGDVIAFNESEQRDMSIIHAGRLCMLEDRLISKLEEFHRENQLETGIRSDNLRVIVDKDVPGEIFALMVSRLALDNKIVVDRNQISIFDFNISISDDDKVKLESIEDIFEKQGFSPLTVEKMITMLNGEKTRNELLFNHLAETGVIVEVTKELYYHNNIINLIKSSLSDYLTANKSISVSDFRDLMKITRKYAVPLLEYFDKMHFTKRIGDKRVLK